MGLAYSKNFPSILHLSPWRMYLLVRLHRHLELVGNCVSETTRGEWLFEAFVKEGVELEERLKVSGVFSFTIFLQFYLKEGFSASQFTNK